MAVEAPKIEATPPVKKAKEPAEIVAEIPAISEARRRLLTYAMIGTIFREMNSQAPKPTEPVEHKVEPKA